MRVTLHNVTVISIKSVKYSYHDLKFVVVVVGRKGASIVRCVKSPESDHASRGRARRNAAVGMFYVLHVDQ